MAFSLNLSSSLGYLSFAHNKKNLVVNNHHHHHQSHKPTMAATTTTAYKPTTTSTANRRSANYQPTTWNHDFLESIANDYAEEIYRDKAKKLHEEVKLMIDNKDSEPIILLQLIDDIQRLGLGYRFRKSITRALDKIASLERFNNGTTNNLYDNALYFRLLREHGYEVSADVFESFKDHNGNFKECLCSDIKGMMSFHEASYLAFEGEKILDEAKAFTTMHLKNHKEGININSSLAKHVCHSSVLPLHHRMPRLEAREYIEAYSGREDANLLLLELAMLDFNMVQSTLQRELQDMSRWWQDIGLANKLSFARDRLMECFFWTVGMVFEPEFSNCRKGLTKVTALITTIDDVYDVYGSLDELEQFTAAVERWEINVVETLPDYMKLCFLALYNTVNEMTYDTLKEHGVNIMPYLTKAWADLCKAFLVEAKWYYNKRTPTFEAYLDNAWRSVSGVVILTHAYFLMTKTITKEALDNLEAYHSLLQFPSMIFRLCNDLGTSKAELERGESVNSILCYMHESGVSEELARKQISSLIDEMWKKMNKYLTADYSTFGKPFTRTAINLARIAQCTYQYGDGHGAPNTEAKNRVLSVVIEPIVLVERNSVTAT